MYNESSTVFIIQMTTIAVLLLKVKLSKIIGIWNKNVNISLND